MDIEESERHISPCGARTLFDVHVAILSQASEIWVNDIIAAHSIAGIAMNDMAVVFTERGASVDVDDGRRAYSIDFP